MSPKAQVVLDFMKANLNRKLSLDELGKSARLSRTHVCRLFKAEAGMPPGQYLQMLRMEKASRLLSTTLLSIKQIMFEVGYSDKSLFVRHFRKAHSLTPSDFRAAHHNFILSKGSVDPRDRNVS